MTTEQYNELNARLAVQHREEWNRRHMPIETKGELFNTLYDAFVHAYESKWELHKIPNTESDYGYVWIAQSTVTHKLYYLERSRSGMIMYFWTPSEIQTSKEKW